MGARPSSFKKGGGFLNNVDGVINGYEFTDDIITKDGREPFTAGKTKGADGKLKERFHSLNVILSARVDGADEDVTTTLFAGSADDFAISEDGQEVWDANFETPELAEEAGQSARQLGAGTGWGKFLNSLVESGFPETLLNETRIEFSAILGTRVRFVQKIDEESTKKFGKRKAKNGKEYNRTDLVVDQVYELPEGQTEPEPAKKGAKPAVKAAPAAKGKPAPVVKGKKAAEPEVDMEEEAKSALREILADAKGHTLPKNKLSMAVLSKRMKDPNREEIRKLLFNDAFLKEQDGWVYKGGLVTLASDTDEAEAEDDAE